MIVRNLVEFPQHTSFFVFGPRQLGKSTWIRKWLINKKAVVFDLLDSKIHSRFLKDPSLLRKEVLYLKKRDQIEYVFIDEIQKNTHLLDEIHKMIEENHLKFILSGSSTRKLKRTHSNLLGGRAGIVYFFPFLYSELKNKFSLSQVLSLGSIPGIYFDDIKTCKIKLQAYVDTYLKEEIGQEGLVRNIGPFHRFLDLAALYFGELLNYENISREGGIPAKTVHSYFEILEDTLVGFELPAWDISVRKQLSKHSKFYFFDNGVVSALTERLDGKLAPEVRGKFFEQWLINEIRARLSYSRAHFRMFFWRTLAGNEVDLVLTKANKIIIAIEIKAKKTIQSKDLRGLKSLAEEYPKLKKMFCVAEVDSSYMEGDIEILHWSDFLNKALPEIIK